MSNNGATGGLHVYEDYQPFLLPAPRVRECLNDYAAAMARPGWMADLEMVTNLTPGDFLRTLEGYSDKQAAEIRRVFEKIDGLTTQIGVMTATAARAQGEHQEMARKLDEHEVQIHGVVGRPEEGLEAKMIRLVAIVEQMEKRAGMFHNRAWELALAFLSGAGVLALAHVLGWKP